jgi:hypothetical protein
MVRYGTWGSSLFQSIYQPAPGTLSNLLRTPELLLLIAVLGVVSILGAIWMPLLLAMPLFLGGVAAVAGRALACGWQAHRPTPGRSRFETTIRRLLTAALFFLQPMARLAGRLRNGLSPWRRRLRPGLTFPHPRTVEVWSETWTDPQGRVQALQDALAASGGLVRSGGPFDRWDLDLRVGPLGGVKIRTAVEEHGSGRQLLRARVWPRASALALMFALALVALTVLFLAWDATGVGVMLGAAVTLLLGLGLEGTSTAMNLALSKLERVGGGPDPEGDNGAGVQGVSEDGALSLARPDVVALRPPEPASRLSEVAAGAEVEKDR